MKKPRKMSAIIADAEKAANSKRFIETMKEDGKKEKVFNYFAFTEYCHKLAEETNAEYGFILRDIVMEKIDPVFNRNKAFSFRGFACID